MSFDFVIGAVDIGPFPSRTSMQKYALAVLNPGEHFRSPRTVEKAVKFCGDFFKEKKKKRLKPVRRQAKIGAGYLNSPPPNWLSLH